MELTEVHRAILEGRREAIKAAVSLCRSSPNAVQADHCPVTHHFAPGMYSREMRIPAGTLLVGKQHKVDHVSTLAQGRIHVFTVDDGPKIMDAPCTFISKAGVQRLGYAETDVVWVTYHATDSTDLADIEREIIQEEL